MDNSPVPWLLLGAGVCFLAGQPGGGIAALVAAWGFAYCTNQHQASSRRRR